jgi:hypothetical protein
MVKFGSATTANRAEWRQKAAVWTLNQDVGTLKPLFGDATPTVYTVSELTWNGRNVRPPMMSFDQTSVLGVLGREHNKPKLSFPLSNKPFCGDIWFHNQHLVASASFIGGLYGDEQYTLRPPYIPELNEFYARTMHFDYSKLRSESERMGIVIDAADTDVRLNALPIAILFERVFGFAGYEAKLSNGGLITKQLIAQLGGLQGARVFKIPGVRRLLRKYGPTESFTKKGALQLIGETDPSTPEARFSDHHDLYIEQRPVGTKLEANDVFGHLVEKGMFRTGVELNCPNCRMTSWISVDTLRQHTTCELCGNVYDATRQLVDSTWHYRRSGVLGAERNAQGAIPVAMTLQQLQTSLYGGHSQVIYSPSLDLTKKGQSQNECEVDFVWIIPRPYPRKTVVLLGECKDQGPINLDEFKRDVENLRRVADSFPSKRFKTFLLVAKLNSFTPDEIEFAKSMNTQYQQRIILLTHKELEPYFIYQRTKAELNVDAHGGSPEDLAQSTAKIYFDASE